MTAKQKRRIARWLMRWEITRRVIKGQGMIIWRLWDDRTYYQIRARMHNERRITLPPED